MKLPRTPEPVRRSVWLVLAVTPLIAILWRWECRSIFYPGWDLVGAANGLFLLSTSSVWDAIKEVFWLSRHFQYWIQTNSILFSLIPGAASSFFPSEYWAHLTSLLVFAISLLLIARIGGLRKEELPFFALLVASSPSLLSFSIAGYPYISGFLPHGLALLLVLGNSRSLHPAILVIAGLVIIELSWHVYELGKTVFVVFFLAALLLPGRPRLDRVLYALLGSLSFGLVLSNKQANVDSILHVQTGLAGVIESMSATLRSIFLDYSMDLPLVAALGLVALFFLPKHRLFFASCLLVQWVLVLLLGIRGIHELRPRRFLVVDMYSLVVILYAFLPHLRNMVNRRLSLLMVSVIGILMLAGVTWQFSNLAGFCRVDPGERNRPLPYTESSSDYFIRPSHIMAAEQIIGLVKKGKHVILLYNYFTYSENTTDPAGLLERVYLKLGHDLFSTNVHVFSNALSRYSRVPINPMATVPAWIDRLDSSFLDNPDAAQQYVVLKYTDFTDKRFKNELEITWNELNSRLVLTRLQEPLRPVMDGPLIPLFEIYAISGGRS